jgi:hypothetical protein
LRKSRLIKIAPFSSARFTGNKSRFEAHGNYNSTSS